MSRPLKLKKGDRLVCTHYRKPYVVEFIEYVDQVEVWVREERGSMNNLEWWGPRSWFRKLPKK